MNDIMFLSRDCIIYVMCVFTAASSIVEQETTDSGCYAVIECHIDVMSTIVTIVDHLPSVCPSVCPCKLF